MTDKASGKDGVDAENSANEPEEEPGIHVGDEVSLDPDAGDLLDPVEDRWWDEEPEVEKAPEKAEPEGTTPTAEPERELAETEEILNVEPKSEPEAKSEAEAPEQKDSLDEILPPARKNRSFKATPKKTPNFVSADPPADEVDEPEKTEDVDSSEDETEFTTGPALVIADEKESEEIGELETKDEPSANANEEVDEATDEPEEKSPPELEKKAAPAPVVLKKNKPVVVEEPEEAEEKPELDLEKVIEEEPESAKEKDDDLLLDDEPVENSETPEAKTKKATDSSNEEDSSDSEDEEDEDEQDKSLLEVLNENQAPVDLASASSYSSTKPKAGCWTIFATLFFFAVLLLLAVVAIGAAIAWSKMGDLEREVDTIAKQKLEERGIYLDYEDWVYEFPRGLVLQNVTVYESAEKSAPSIQASDIGVNVDFVGLARDRESLSGAELSFDDSNLSFFENGNAAVNLQNIDGEIFVDRSQVSVERFSGEVGGLRVTATGSYALPEKSEGRGGSNGEGGSPSSPKTFSFDLSPLKNAAEMLAIETEGEKPVLSVEFEKNDEAENADLQATLSGRDFTWHGVPITSATAAFTYEPDSKVLNFSNFQVGCGEGFVGGIFKVATVEKRIDIERAQSSVDLLALYTSLKPEAAEKFSKVAMTDAPNVKFSGTVPLETPDSAKLLIDYEHRKGIVYKAEKGDLPITDIRGQIDLNNGRLETNDLAGNLLGGLVSLNGTVNLGTEGTPFSGLIDISKLPLDNASAFFGKEDIGMTGDLYMNFRGVGYADVSRIRGGGDVRVEQAILPTFPVVGPVQELLGKVIPAFRFDEAGSVEGSYLVESGVLLTNNFRITNSSAELLVNGSVKLEQQSTDFTATASLNEPLAKATGLEGKSVEVRGYGPLAQPELTLRDFPVEFAAKGLHEILGTSPESLGSLTQIISEQDNAAEVITGSIEEATGIELGETVGALLQGLVSPDPEPEEGAETTAEPEPEPEPVEPAKPVIRATVVEPE